MDYEVWEVVFPSWRVYFNDIDYDIIYHEYLKDGYHIVRMLSTAKDVKTMIDSIQKEYNTHLIYAYKISSNAIVSENV